MRLSLIGMAGAGKSYWANRLAQQGFRCFCCDDLIAKKLAPMLKRYDGTAMGMGEWMGFPFQDGYKKREYRYLSLEIEVLSDILKYLESRVDNAQENIVVDTTGSVVYTGEEILSKLRQHTTVVYLSAPPEIHEELLNAYVSKPHPMLWRDVFNKRPEETNKDALARCYPKLLYARQRLYERYADVTVDYYTRRQNGFSVNDFITKIRRESQDG